VKIKVYQIDHEKDAWNVMFMDYAFTGKHGGVNPAVYKCVFDGNVDAGNLEEIFALLNTQAPVGYNGHSLSVSDIVETEEGFHFCDSFGFKKLESFDVSQAEPITGHRMLVVEPHKEPYEMVIPEGLEPLQQAVGGIIDCTYPFDDNTYVISNDEAKCMGLDGNRRIYGSIYAGVFLIAADDGYGGTADLTDEQVEKYTEMFREPEEISPEEVQDDMGFTVICY